MIRKILNMIDEIEALQALAKVKESWLIAANELGMEVHQNLLHYMSGVEYLLLNIW